MAEQLRLFEMQAGEFVHYINDKHRPRIIKKCTLCGRDIDVSYNGYDTNIGRVCDKCYDGCLLEYERKVRKLFKAGFFK